MLIRLTDLEGRLVLTDPKAVVIVQRIVRPAYNSGSIEFAAKDYTIVTTTVTALEVKEAVEEVDAMLEAAGRVIIRPGGDG